MRDAQARKVPLGVLVNHLGALLDDLDCSAVFLSGTLRFPRDWQRVELEPWDLGRAVDRRRFTGEGEEDQEEEEEARGLNFPLAGRRGAAFSGPFFFYDRPLYPT
jgi:hypothetical protein